MATLETVPIRTWNWNSLRQGLLFGQNYITTDPDNFEEFLNHFNTSYRAVHFKHMKFGTTKQKTFWIADYEEQKYAMNDVAVKAICFLLKIPYEYFTDICTRHLKVENILKSRIFGTLEEQIDYLTFWEVGRVPLDDPDVLTDTYLAGVVPELRPTNVELFIGIADSSLAQHADSVEYILTDLGELVVRIWTSSYEGFVFRYSENKKSGGYMAPLYRVPLNKSNKYAVMELPYKINVRPEHKHVDKFFTNLEAGAASNFVLKLNERIEDDLVAAFSELVTCNQVSWFQFRKLQNFANSSCWRKCEGSDAQKGYLEELFDKEWIKDHRKAIRQTLGNSAGDEKLMSYKVEFDVNELLLNVHTLVNDHPHAAAKVVKEQRAYMELAKHF